MFTRSELDNINKYGWTPPSYKKIFINDINDIEIELGWYVIKNCKNYISVQHEYFPELKEEMYEVWNLCEEEEDVRRCLTKEEVKELIVQVFNRSN